MEIGSENRGQTLISLDEESGRSQFATGKSGSDPDFRSRFPYDPRPKIEEHSL